MSDLAKCSLPRSAGHRDQVTEGSALDFRYRIRSSFGRIGWSRRRDQFTVVEIESPRGPGRAQWDMFLPSYLELRRGIDAQSGGTTLRVQRNGGQVERSKRHVAIIGFSAAWRLSPVRGSGGAEMRRGDDVVWTGAVGVDRVLETVTPDEFALVVLLLWNRLDERFDLNARTVLKEI